MTTPMHLVAFASQTGSVASGSPNNSSEESLGNDDSFMFMDDFDGLPDMPEEVNLADGEQPKRKSRRPPSTAERRATHNAVERARRESLNGRFVDLAAALPSMANVKRPSKSMIVNKSIDFIQNAVSREQALVAENDTLRAEINELRARLGMPVSTPTAISTAAKTAPRRRQPSMISIASDHDSPLNGSPLSMAGSLDSVKPDNASSVIAAMPSASLSSISEAPVEMPNTASTLGSASSPITPGFPHNGFPMFDMQYLMALSMQQQQAQSMLKMSGGNPFAFAPPWPAVPMPMSCAPPVSTAPDFAGNWLFA